MARKLGVAVLVLLAALTITGVAVRARGRAPRRGGTDDPVRRSRRRGRPVVREPAAQGGARRRDRARHGADRRLGRDRHALRELRRGLLRPPGREPRRDGRPRGTQLGHRAHGRPRVRASRRRESPPRRARRAERDAALVEGARNGVPRRRPERARPLPGRLGALDQRGLRRGLRVHESQGPLQDRVARAPEHDGAAGDPCRPRSGGAAQDHHHAPGAEAGRDRAPGNPRPERPRRRHLRAAGAEPPRPTHRHARRRRSRRRLVRHHVPCPRVGGGGADVARASRASGRVSARRRSSTRARSRAASASPFGWDCAAERPPHADEERLEREARRRR